MKTKMLTLLTGDWMDRMPEVPGASIQCCVTSPPYWGLRDYKHPGQLGLEKTPEEYVSKLVAGFREVRRVLKDDGTLWLNLGDAYNGSGKARRGGGAGPSSSKQKTNAGAYFSNGTPVKVQSCKPKDLIGIPWMVAFALRNDGWYLRSDIIWSKPNPMPESVTDRPTRAHEYIFLLTKKAKYYYDHEAIKEPPSPALINQIEGGYNGSAVKDFGLNGVQDASATKSRIINGYRKRIDRQRGHSRRRDGFNDRWDGLTKEEQMMCGSNKRSVWTVAPANYRDAHFATFPPKLITPCILSGSRPGDTVLDPFGGSGTTAEVAISHGRKALIIELNPEYVPMIHARCEGPLAQRRQQTLFP